MKVTKTKLIEDSNIPKGLIKSTINQFGGWEEFKQAAPDVVNYCINGGFGSFIYYSDTVPFGKRHRTSIMRLAVSQADDFGMGVFEMIKSFGCLKDTGIKTNDLASIIYTAKGDDDETAVFNCLAWYAGEEVCRAYCDMIEE